jgi:hypothetical protein
VLAEVAAPGPVTLLTGVDFAVGACYAAVGVWLLRTSRRGRDTARSGADRLAGDLVGGWLALAVAAAWFLGTAAASWPAYAASIAVLGYRAMLTHLLLHSVNHQRTPSRRAALGMRLAIVLCYAAVLLPVPADGFVTAGLMAGLAGLAVRRVAADRRPVLLAVALAAATLAATWWLAASGTAGGDVLTLVNDVALIVAAVAVIGLGIKVAWAGDELDRARALARRPPAWFASRDEAAARYLRVSGLAGLVAAGGPAVEAGLREQDGRWRLAMDPGAFAVGAPDMPLLLARSRVPVTLARGEHDAMNTGGQLARLGVPAVTLPGLGHNAHVENPQLASTLLDPYRYAAGQPA